MITYNIDTKQPKKSKKTILEARLKKLFLSVLIALILIIAFCLIYKVEGVLK
ncbi:hypothetical protein [Helicobacter pylori]|uniref:hypothetical protein n=1 Tax=Helicobacter pylori TaxID=210 RepID=UPI001ABB5FAB|nr:hypothetical protein [Helicobacter pylori]WRE18307.1 hypothetical protein KVE44_03105 [Helicobacter pylori]